MVVQPTIRGVASTIYRRKWSMLLVMAVIGGLGAAYLLGQEPTYRSDALMVVRFGRSAMPTTNLARDSTPLIVEGNERRDVVTAHTDILTSPDVARAAIQTFGVERLYPNLVENPPALGSPLDAAVKRFAGALFVSGELSGNAIRVGFSHKDPRIAKAMLEVLLEEYMQRESRIFSGASYDFQKSQVDLANKRLTAAQHALSDYKVASGVSDFDSQMGALIKQQSDLGIRLQGSQVALAESNERKTALTKLLATVPSTIANSSGAKYAQFDDAQTRLNTLRAQERELVASKGPDWPAVKALRASIAEVTASTSAMASSVASRQDSQTSSVYQDIQLDLLRATAKATSDAQAVTLMKSQLDALQAQADDLEALHAGLTEREREVALADSAYRALVLHLEDSRIGTDRLRDGISRVAQITQPNLPYAISSPRYVPTGLTIAAVALVAALVVGFLLEFMDDRLVTPDQVASRLKVPVLASFDKA